MNKHTDANVTDVELVDRVKSNTADYARKTIVGRAIPDLRDGMKPVQRMIMWQLHRSRLNFDAKHMKVATFSGRVLQFHPHGSGSVDGAVVGLAQDWARRMPLTNIKGNKGSVMGLTPAASRYIECRQSKTARLLLAGLDQNAVDMVSNYDGTAEQPVVLPSAIPVSMVNGTLGMALGMRTDILPHNPAELVELMKLEIKGELDVESAKTVYNGPDFPTGNELVDSDPYIELYDSSSSYKIRAAYELETNAIVITEVPFGLTTDKLITSLVKVAAHVNEVTDINDESSTFPNVRIVIKCKRGTSEPRLREIAALLENRTEITRRVSANNLLISNGVPRYMTMLEVIKDFVEYRSRTLERVWAFDLEKFEAELEIIEAEIKVASDPQALAKILDEASGKPEMVEMLIEAFEMTRRQADHVAGMSLHRVLKSDMNRAEELDGRKNRTVEKINDRKWRLGEGRVKALLEDCDNSLEVLKEAGLDKRLTRIGGTATQVSREVKQRVKAEAQAVPSLKRFVGVSTDSPVIFVATNEQAMTDRGNRIKYIETSTDKYIGAVTRSGKYVVRLVNDIEGEERITRTVDEIGADEVFLDLFEFDDKMSVVTMSRRGYMKHIPHANLLPNVGTRRYIKKAHIVSGLKGGDDALIRMFNIKTSDVGNTTLTVKTDRTRGPNQDITLDVVAERNDKGGSSGARYFETHDGKDRVLDVVIAEDVEGVEGAN